MELDSDAVKPKIRPHPSRDGVQIVDPIQDAQFTLLTPEPADVSNCPIERFHFPIDEAVSVQTDTIETPYFVGAWVRDESGNLVADLDEGESVSFPPAQYNIEIATTRVKLYLNIEGELLVETADNCLRFSLVDSVGIHVGARSFHEQPAATVTTTDEPVDVMSALSTLGSALKTTSCERSFPTLRGHPPLVERGEELSIPDGIDLPDTDLTIQVPESLEYIYPVATLAYYLGATIEPGPDPRILTSDWEYSLEGDKDFETRTAEVLQRIFTLDCVTRTEGYYDVNLHERNVIEERNDLDFESLYDKPLAEQIRTYLNLPESIVSDSIPRWKLTADIRPTFDHVSTLPFLANELAIIRCPRQPNAGDLESDEVIEKVESIFRGSQSQLMRGSNTRTTRTRSSLTGAGTIFRPDASDSIEQVYVGDGVPLGASKMSVDSYYRRLEYEPSEQPHNRVIVVCNDERMADENVVSEIYGARDWLQFDIRFEEELTKDEMRTLLKEDADFLHYIGHVDKDGIRCPDGHLDTRKLPEVNVSAFLLNACDSYEQGYGLVEHGAMAGIATVTDVVNEAATSVGRTVAKLLNQGFSIASTLEIIKQYEQIGHHYVVIGDGGGSIVEHPSGTPHRLGIEKLSPEEFECTIFGYPNLSVAMGSIFSPTISSSEEYYINSGEMFSETVSKRELEKYLSGQESPIEYENSLFWSDSIEFD